MKLPAISLGLWHNFGGDSIFETMREMCRAAFDLGIPGMARQGRDVHQHVVDRVDVGVFERVGDGDLGECGGADWRGAGVFPRVPAKQ